MFMNSDKYMLLYRLVNCQWSDWNYDSCSKTCGGGVHTKTRSKTIEEVNGGTCNGAASMVESCNNYLCPGE